MPSKSKKPESQGLDASPWQAADKLRSQMDAAEDKHVVLEPIFPMSIAHELVETVHRDAKTESNVKEQVRAKLGATIRRLLLKYGYPPDQEPAATRLVLEPTEVIAGEKAA